MKKLNQEITAYALALIMLFTAGCGRGVEEDEELYPFETTETIEGVIDGISSLTPLDDSETETKKLYYHRYFEKGHDIYALLEEYNLARSEEDAEYSSILLAGIGHIVLGENIIDATKFPRDNIIKVTYDSELGVYHRALIYVANSAADLEIVKKERKSYEEIPYMVYKYKLSKELLAYFKKLERFSIGKGISLEEIDEFYIQTMDLLLQSSVLEGNTISSEPSKQKIKLYESSK